MKSVGQPSNYFSPDSKAVSSKAPLANPVEQSPYLRAVLSDRRTSAGTAKILSISSMAAALRYISSTGKQTIPGKLITPNW